MKDFRITVEETVYYQVVVQAETLEQAKTQLEADLDRGINELDLYEVNNSGLKISNP